ncbi:MAG: hypothetical protein Q8K66_13060 [Sediminibacterium sp.]|nr:hypothetical protein [Sediminibacterium sp.]MDP3128836.1 hypothetical protein [Sediminibacterium sp.]
MSKRILFSLFVSMFAFTASAQQVVEAKQIKAADSIKIKDSWVKKVVRDTTLVGSTDRDLPSVPAIKGYVDNRLIYKVNTDAIYNDPVWLNTLAWIKITSTPTTKGGYNITDVPTYSDTTSKVYPYWSNPRGFITSASLAPSWDSAYQQIPTGADFVNGVYSLIRRSGQRLSVSLDGRYQKYTDTAVQTANYTLLDGTRANGTWNISITGNSGTVANGVYTTGSYGNPLWITSLAWAKITGTPTTLGGYGITDAYTKTNVNDSLAAVQGRVQTKSPLAGSGSIVSLGTISIGVWNGTAITDTYISSATTWNAKQNALGYTPENISNKAVANGYADLDALGKIPASRIDFGQTGQTFVVASQAAMLAVSGANVGALAIRTDENKNYRLIAQPASTLANWQVLLSPDAPVQSVNGFTGNVNLLTTHISEGSNYYWTAARSRAGQSITTAGGSGAATYDNTTGVLNIPVYQAAGTYLTNFSFTNSTGITGTVTNPTTTPSLSLSIDSSAIASFHIKVRSLFTAGAGISIINGAVSSTITQYTDALARASLSFAAGTGAYNSTTGVITIPTNTNQLTNGAGFITGYTETDPVYTASSWFSTTNNSANWNTAYGWGNHSGLYLSLTGGALSGLLTASGVSSSFLKSTGRIFITGDTNYGDMVSTNGTLIFSYDPVGQVANISSYNYTTALTKPMNFTASSFSFYGTTTINTTTPTALTLNTTSSGASLELKSSSGTPSDWIVQSEGTGAAFFKIYSVTASAYRAIIDGSGNLTIGATPGAGTGSITAGAISGSIGAFSGNVTVSSASTSGMVVNSTSGTSWHGYTLQSSGVTQGGMELSNNTGEIRIGGFSSINDYYPTIYSDGVAALTFGLGAAPSAIFFGSITTTNFIGPGTGLTGITNTNLSGTAGITNANLANSSVTINGVAVSLGASGNIINGTGFVKATGTTISYDNSTYLTTTSASLYSGEYTPATGTDSTNCTYVSNGTLTYSRNGNTIIISGSFKINPDGAGDFFYAIGLPSSWTISSTTTGGGSANTGTSTAANVIIKPFSSTKIGINGYATATGIRTFFFTAQFTLTGL